MQCTLSLDNIHSQWQLDRPVILPLLPVAQFAKVRNPIEIQSSCKKEEDPWGHPIILHIGTPSRFELVENADTGRRCGHCVVRGIGHYSKTCPECSRIMAIQWPFNSPLLDA